jgi:hypothetical protein
MGLFKQMFNGTGVAPINGALAHMVFSPSEVTFFRLLQEVTKDLPFIIFPKICLNHAISLPQKDKQKYTLEDKFVDFMLCDKDTFQPIIVIELDDSTTNRPDSVTHDFLINRVLEEAEIKLIRINVQREYDADQIKDMIQNQL